MSLPITSCPILAHSRRREETPQKRARNKLWESGGYGKTEEVNPTLTVSFLPLMRRRWKSCVCCLPHPEQSSTLFLPIIWSSAVTPAAPSTPFPPITDPQSTKSTSCITPYLVPSPSPISSFNIRWIPWRVCAFSCFSSSIQNFHTFLIPLLFSSIKMPVSLWSRLCSCSPPCLCCLFSLWIYAIVDPPVWGRTQHRVRAAVISGCLYHFTAYQRGFISEAFFSRKRSRIVWQSPFLVWKTGHQAARTGCLRCPCTVRKFQLLGCLSLWLKVYLFKKYLDFRQVIRSISYFSVFLLTYSSSGVED